MAFLEMYKKGQGSKARLVGMAGSFALVIWGAYALWVQLQGAAALTRPLVTVPKLSLDIDLAMIIAVLVGVVACGLVVMILNRPRLVDLLIDTESEMKKVSWPSRQEAWNSSVVVVVTVLVMMGLLFFYDFILNQILKQIFYSGGA